MDREEAIKLFKELIDECKINLSSVSLVPPRRDDTLSDGYQLHIKSFFNSYDREIIQTIVQEHHLTWKEVNENIVIYKPQK